MHHYQLHHSSGQQAKLLEKDGSGTSNSKDNIHFDPSTYQFEDGEGIREEDLPPNHVNDIYESDLSEDVEK